LYLNLNFPIKDKYTEEEKEILGKGHMKKISISDAIFVVNKDGYIGKAVMAEIKYAKEQNKEIIYLENSK